MKCPIIPVPVRGETRPGAFPLDQPATIPVSAADCPEPVRERLGVWLTFFEKLHPSLAPPRLTGYGTEPRGRTRDDGHGSDRRIRFTEATDPERVGSEGYELIVEPGDISIAATTPAGWFYGWQSLLQLINPRDSAIPACRIFDRPRYPWRGMHLDVCRHFFPVHALKRLLDAMAVHKLNRFHWHLTEDQGWRLPIPRFPRLTEIGAWRDEDGERYGGFYSEDDIVEVIRYAADRAITVVPEIEMPGHALAALAAYPEFSCTGEPFSVGWRCGVYDDVFCAGNDAAIEFLKGVLTETARLFPGDTIHIGGDECPKVRWSKCPRCRDRMRKHGLADEAALQSWFIGQMTRHLDRLGKRSIGWDEILGEGLPAGTAIMSWRGVEGGLAAAKLGRDVVMSPGSHCYLDHFPSDAPEEPGNHAVLPIEKVYQYEPTPPELSGDAARHILGTQGNIWTERMKTARMVEYMAFPRMCALSEVAWSDPDRRDWAGFQQRLEPHLDRLNRIGIHYRHPDDKKREIPL